VDANSILTVTAVEKGVGKGESISITNENGRMSQEEIERLVRESQEFAEEDKEIKERLDAKHSLQNYLYTMRNTVEDRDKLADKLSSDDKDTILDAIKQTEEWLASNEHDADRDAFEGHMKELQRVCDPIIASIYQG